MPKAKGTSRRFESLDNNRNSVAQLTEEVRKSKYMIKKVVKKYAILNIKFGLHFFF